VFQPSPRSHTATGQYGNPPSSFRLTTVRCRASLASTRRNRSSAPKGAATIEEADMRASTLVNARPIPRRTGTGNISREAGADYRRLRAGERTDVSVRLMAERLSTIWGQQAVVDNRPGGGGAIAARAGQTATPDGYTLYVGAAPPANTTPKSSRVLRSRRRRNSATPAQISGCCSRRVRLAGEPFRPLNRVHAVRFLAALV
jgi:hypothetical protein